MNMITKLATKLLATLSVVAVMAMLVQALDTSDMAFAFGAKAASAGQQVDLASARNLTPNEMNETEGAFLPWVIRAGVSGGIAGFGAGAASWTNGNRGWAVVRHTALGFATGATGGVASKWLGKRGW